MADQIVNRKLQNTSMLYLLVFKIISIGAVQVHVIMDKDRKNKNNKALTKVQIEQSRLMVVYITDIVVEFIIQCMMLISIIMRVMFSVFRKSIVHGVKKYAKPLYNIWLHNPYFHVFSASSSIDKSSASLLY